MEKIVVANLKLKPNQFGVDKLTEGALTLNCIAYKIIFFHNFCTVTKNIFSHLAKYNKHTRETHARC